MNIIKYPNNILNTQLLLFDFDNPIMDPVALETQMISTMFENGGIGLAANQVGINARVFVMGHKELASNAQAFFNPEVIKVVDDMESLPEGCLSFPGIFVKIKRPKKILARWQNSTGTWEEGTFEGYDCKCFLHELDHLEGITFRDRVSPLKWQLANKKANKRK